MACMLENMLQSFVIAEFRKLAQFDYENRFDGGKVVCVCRVNLKVENFLTLSHVCFCFVLFCFACCCFLCEKEEKNELKEK